MSYWCPQQGTFQYNIIGTVDGSLSTDGIIIKVVDGIIIIDDDVCSYFWCRAKMTFAHGNIDDVMFFADNFDKNTYGNHDASRTTSRQQTRQEGVECCTV